MNNAHWLVNPSEVFDLSKVMPVLVIKDTADAVPIAEALIAGGVKVLEVTLRTPNALEVIKEIADNCPEAVVGAGTVINPEQLQKVEDAGGKFAISPGLTPTLLEAGNKGNIALIPGISSISELMLGIEHGYSHFKFFPAESSGGVGALKSFSGPFPDIKFCPTGGINPDNICNYLALNNVYCCGGSWLCPESVVKAKDWQKITDLALATTSA